MEQQLNLFGDEVIETAVKRIGRNERFEDYDAFIDKHEIKKTTDDCYTPTEVYKVIRDYVGELTDLSDRAVVRPFFPGGDYQRFGYPEDCIVIDNPPFSIITKIVRWYDQAGIDYFLFAPHITIFDCQAPCSVLTDANIKYANGAVVKTSFVTNIIHDTRVWLNADLRKRINDCCDIKEHPTEKKSYPSNVINAASCGKFLSRGFDLKIPNDESQYVRNIDELQNEGMRIFGGGMLLSDRIAEIFDKEKAKKYERIVNLSERERRIIERLNQRTEKKSKGLHDQFSEEYDKFINATWYNSIDKTPEEGEEVRIRIITNERVIEKNAVFKMDEPTGEPAFFWETGFFIVSTCVLWRRFAKCEQTED